MNHYECLSCGRKYLAKCADKCRNCKAGTAWQRLTGTVELPGMEGAQLAQAEAVAKTLGDSLTAQMLQPIRFDFDAAGPEQQSLMFVGTPTNPQARLF